MKWLLGIISVLVAYGSLYPFDFQMKHVASARGFAAPLFELSATSLGDILGNIALFVPYGFVGVLSATRVRSGVARLVLALVSGTALALALQIAQLFLPSRDATLVDVFWNALGILVGAALAFAPPVRRLLSVEAGSVRLDVPVMLAGMWVVAELAPFVPSLDLQLVKQSLKPLVMGEAIRAGETCLHFAGWLIALRFLAGSGAAPLRRRAFLSTLPLAVIAVQPFILGNSLHLHEVVGVLGALVVWLGLGRFLHPLALAGLLAVGMLSVNLSPIVLGDVQRGFSWIPFSGFLEGSMVANAMALVNKLFLFGSLVWLLVEGGIGWTVSTALTVAVLLVQERLQIFVPGSTPEVTDPILAVVLAFAMRLSTGGREVHREVQLAAPKRDRGRLLIDSLPAPAPAMATDATLAVRRLEGLDGLRGLAALAVFAVHFNQTANIGGQLGPFDLARLLENGNTGVGLFFVLSGFLLSIPFWGAQGQDGMAVDRRAYALRRVARIVPAYYLCLFTIISAKGVLAGSWPSSGDVLSHVLFLHNLDDAHALSFNPPFWTLAVEMQFYLLLPLVFLILNRVSSRVAVAIVVGLCLGPYVADAALMSYLTGRGRWPIEIEPIWPLAVRISGPSSFALEYSTLRHLTFFFLGVATAWLHLRHQSDAPRSSVADGVFWGAALFTIVILSTPLDDVLRLPYGRYNWPVVPLLLAAVVFMASRAPVARAVLGWWPVSSIGLVSYGIYIYHYPLQKTVARLMGSLRLSPSDHWIAFGIVSFALTLAVAAVSYRLLEQPIIEAVRKMRGIGRRPGPAPRAPRDWSSVSIGLGVEPLERLHRVATERGASVSGAARHIIGEFMRGLDHEFDDQPRPGRPRSAHSGTDALVGAGRRAEAVHRHVVNLRPQQAEFLRELSVRMGVSLSRTVEMIVDAYVREAAARGPGEE